MTKRAWSPGLAVWLPLALGSLAAAPAARAEVAINEILAANIAGLVDADGESSDWIELRNFGAATCDISGWYLTDDAADPRKWRLPAAPELALAPGAYLVIFASGKNRRVPGAELHTSFRLASGGEYIALVEADGVTVAHEYAPEYPRQRDGISYGLAARVETLVDRGLTIADIIVPASGALGTQWTQRSFVPGAAWSRGVRAAIGYDTAGNGGGPAPISSWGLDGSLADGSGTNHGTFAGGAAQYVEGHDGTSGGALRFDGSDDYLEIPAAGGLPVYNLPAYTIALWVNGQSQNDRRVYAEGSSSNQNPLFTIGTERTGATGQVDVFIRFASGSGPTHIVSSGTAFDGTWHHIAWVDRAGDAALYIDGVRDPVDFSYAKEAMTLNRVAFGAVLRATSCCQFSGALDSVGVWSQALADAEIADLAAGAPPGAGSLFARSIDTDVAASMAGVNASLYARFPFAVAAPGEFDSLALKLQYDDGAIVYLNGVEVARRNAPAGAEWSSAAPSDRPDRDATTPEAINLTSSLGLLLTGENVLAVHGLSLGPSDADFLLSPELVAAGSIAAERRYFLTPTPGAANGSGFVDFVADTVFSSDRGFHEAPFEVAITTATPGATIRFTRDGSLPTASHGETYGAPVGISTTTTLRAAAFKDGFEPTNVDTHTYLFLDDVIRQPASPAGYPASWAGYAADYAMDPEVCTNTASPHYQPTIREDLKAIPTLSLVLDTDDIFGPSRGIYTHPESRGDAWERPASVELFSADGSTDEFQIDCGVRLQGGSSARPIEGKHSFRLLFKSLYGKSKLKEQFFPDSNVERFDGLVLRCFSTDGWAFKDGGSRYRRWDSQYIRDLWMKDSQLAMGQLSGHNRYVHLYINGLYWGLYNPTERPDDSFQSAYQGGAEEDWDIVKDFTELFRGNLDAWNQMMSQASAGLGTAASYQRIQGNNPDGTPNPAYPVLLDTDNLIDYMCLHFFAGAEDWPHHNWYAARSRAGDLGGWRYFVWDQEIVLDFAYRNRIDVNNTGSPSFVYSRLRANPEFLVGFGDRVHQHLFNGGALSVAAGQERWLTRAGEIDRAIVGESARWGDYRVDHPDPTNSPAELYTRDIHWVAERERVIETYIPESHRLAIERFKTGGLYPQTVAPMFSQHGGLIAPGFELAITAPAGTVYYTLDGSDPRLAGGAVSPAALRAGDAIGSVLVPSGAPVRARVPTSGAEGLAWTQIDFDDSAWTAGTTGVGFERTTGYEALLGTDLESLMDGINATFYSRVRFTLDSEPAAIDTLTLRMKNDDGFIAYINGTLVASRNAPATPLWSSQATQPTADADAVVFADFDVTSFKGTLRRGANVLAIHGLNSSPSSGDALVLPELVTSASTGGGIPLSEPTVVKARAFASSWSALNEALFWTDVPLRITEVMYHPAPAAEDSPFDAEDYEFIEIENVGAEPIDLTGLRLTGAVELDLTGAFSEALPGGIFVAVANFAAFYERYGVGTAEVAGQYSGRLSNGGEALRLAGSLGEPILELSYDDAWYPSTDGEGPSLVIIDPSGETSGWSEATSWRPSAFAFGSPGASEVPPPLGGRQLPSDFNQDRALDISDAVSLLGFLFISQTFAPPCADGPAGAGNRVLLDANRDGAIDIADAVRVLSHLFQGGPPPVLGRQCIPIEGCPEACGG